MVGNSLLRQERGIPMGIDPAPLWTNIFLYTCENEYISELISNDKVKARHFHATQRFIDDLDTLNDGGLFKLKAEHSGKNATFLNLDIMVKDEAFLYKLFDKRDAFPFFIIRMPCNDSNISKSIFYSALVREFIRLACSSLLYKEFN